MVRPGSGDGGHAAWRTQYWPFCGFQGKALLFFSPRPPVKARKASPLPGRSPSALPWPQGKWHPLLSWRDKTLSLTACNPPDLKFPFAAVRPPSPEALPLLPENESALTCSGWWWTSPLRLAPGSQRCLPPSLSAKYPLPPCVSHRTWWGLWFQLHFPFYRQSSLMISFSFLFSFLNSASILLSFSVSAARLILFAR